MPSGTNPVSTQFPASLTVSEVAQNLHCSERTIRSLVASGKLSGFYVGLGTRSLRVTAAALAAYIESAAVVPAGTAKELA